MTDRDPKAHPEIPDSGRFMAALTEMAALRVEQAIAGLVREWALADAR